jgi:Zn-finger protein
LQKYGSLKILLPDNVELEIGTTQEDKYGKEVKSDNYCYVIATKENKATVLDSFNLGIRFSNDDDNCILDDTFVDSEGNYIRQLNVV